MSIDTKKYFNKGIFIDTNILLLLYIGSYDTNLIETFKRTNKFTKKDYKILTNFLSRFNKIITTPNVLTELDNFFNQLSSPIKEKVRLKLKEHIEVINENYIKSIDVTNSNKFLGFGLTDIGILNAIRDKYILLTEDFPLSNYANSIKIDAINFNHLRNYLYN